MIFPSPQIGEGQSITEALRVGAQGQLALAGMCGGALGRYVAAYYEKYAGRILVVTPDVAAANTTTQDIAFHLSDRHQQSLVQFPAYEMGPYDDVLPDRSSALARASALYQLRHGLRQDGVLVVTASDLLRKMIPVELFDELCFNIAAGQTVERAQLIQRLEDGQYSRAVTVEEPGTYSVRGGIVDVFLPHMDTPVCIDFFGDTVEGIFTFDTDSHRRNERLEQLTLYPARQLIPPTDDDERLLAWQRIRDMCDAVNMPTAMTELVMEDLTDGRMIVGYHRYLPALHPQLSTLFDYFDSQLLVMPDVAGVEMAYKQQWKRADADYGRCRQEGITAAPPEAYQLAPEVFAARLDGHQRRIVQSWQMATAAETEAAQGIAATPDGASLHEINVDCACFSGLQERLSAVLREIGADGLIDEIASYLSHMATEGYAAVISAHTKGAAKRLREMLSHRNIDALAGDHLNNAAPGQVSIIVGELSQGYVWPADALCVVAEEEIFTRRRRRAASKGKKQKSIFDLQTLAMGDYVVHREHGIGKYLGLHSRDTRYGMTDFLLLEYRGGDKLYLPVYRLSMVQKYRNASEANIVLDKLGGVTFTKSRARAQKNAMRLAAKLLEVYARKAMATRPSVDAMDDLYRSFEASFPFEETDDQAAAIDDVMADLEDAKPMDRLICGDVGFGKTEVALRAAFRVVNSGRQVAIMVPTTVLAQQHYEGFKRRFAPYPVEVALVSRFRSAKQNKETVAGLKKGQLDIVIGTHRLLSADVHFKRLGLLVIDEEHRFGVTHKERIRSIKASVDTLAMTATPIPRTLHMAFSKLRDLSLITTPPVNRRPVKTLICHDDGAVIRDAITRELGRDGQVYFLHNRVRGIDAIASRLQKLVPDARVVVAHGQMKESTLESVMNDFIAGRFDVLVSTAIIESGLDIPRVNTIFIDRADTLGLAQLYQLRGRVGRSDRQAYAYLMVPPLEMLTANSKKRLDALTRNTNLGAGFEIANTDLEIRGAGNLLGEKQSGSVAGVGFEMYLELLEEACASLEGKEKVVRNEPEVQLERPGILPDTYIEDERLRLHYYKELSGAFSEEELGRTTAELVDRFGALPVESDALISGMLIKVFCRQLRIAGLETTAREITIHLGHDATLDPQQLLAAVAQSDSNMKLHPDMRLEYTLDTEGSDRAMGANLDTNDRAIQVLRELKTYAIKRDGTGDA